LRSLKKKIQKKKKIKNLLSLIKFLPQTLFKLKLDKNLKSEETIISNKLKNNLFNNTNK
jgi:hypothetical protein